MGFSHKTFSLFMVLWAGQLLSRLGSGISAFVLGVYLFQKTSSTSAFSLLLLCAFLPSVLLAPMGGVLADRHDRKLLMIMGDMGACFGTAFTIVMHLITPDREWPIYLGVAISAIFTALHSPAFKASVTELVAETQYARASGLIQLAEASRHMLAPAIGAFLITRMCLSMILIIDMLTFMGAALAVVFIRKNTIQKKTNVERISFQENLIAGIHYISGNRFILHLLCLTSVVTFLVGILQSLLMPMVLSFADAKTFGNIQSLGASGMVLSSLLIGSILGPFSPEKILGYSFFIAGIFYALIGLTENIKLITPAFFCFLFTLPFVNTSLEVLFRQRISNGLQGRVWSIISLISQTGMLIAYAIAGILVDHLFNPLLVDGGLLANTVGRVIGTGAARGSGLLILISGILLIILSKFIVKPTPAIIFAP